MELTIKDEFVIEIQRDSFSLGLERDWTFSATSFEFDVRKIDLFGQIELPNEQLTIAHIKIMHEATIKINIPIFIKKLQSLALG